MDEETGLYYYGARYYNPRESVWLSVDPLAGYNPVFEVEHYIDGQHNGGVYNAMNLNVYGYTYQNPIIYIDPNGKQSMSDVEAKKNFSYTFSFQQPQRQAGDILKVQSSSVATGGLYGAGRTLNMLGSNKVVTRVKFSGATPGTSIAANYFRDKFGGKLLPKSIRFSGKTMSTMNNKIFHSPVLTNDIGGLAGRSVPILGRGLVVGNLGLLGYNIATSENPREQTVREGFTWAGAIGGAEVGAELGSVAGPWGTAIGGVAGGIIGGVAGENFFEPHRCDGCIRPRNYLEEGMRIDGGLKGIQDKLNAKKTK